ncbi:MAG: F0F1 ATP synthase subunit A [Elusimicrobia bacterium]|nr:F0F1 ATP synthase subunit A [Elusimicrobiota bacterium]
MDFEHELAHHLIDHKLFHFMVGPLDLGLSPLILTMWAACAFLVVSLSLGARADKSFSRSVMEPLVLYVRDEMVEPIFGHHTDIYLPYFLTLFFFLLTCNFFGLIPGASGVTANIAVTASLAICTFLLMQFAGIKEQGLGAYLAHIVPSGVPWWLWPLLFVIEVFGMAAKCISLCIRLFANMLAGHVVVLSFISLIFIFAEMSHVAGYGVSPAAVGLALFIMLMDVLVSVLQAYIFTFLTILFVGSSVHPH